MHTDKRYLADERCSTDKKYPTDKKCSIDKKIQEYVEAHHQETIALLKELAVIPAPSCQEEKRAGAIIKWLHEAGAREAFIDETGNVVYPYQCDTFESCIVVMSHMDVVCPDTESLPLEETEGRLIGPGVRDDTANLVNMMMAVKFLLQHTEYKPQTGILFVADVGEEGLGNLKGSRQILQTYGKRIREWISFDLNYDTIYTRAVGSRRYRITVHTKGGHSYHDFGSENAIAQAAELICDLYKMEMPEAQGEKKSSKATYNVGKIEGGTSVNTIAQEASFLYEIRAEGENILNEMDRRFHEIVYRQRMNGMGITEEILGIRPGNGQVCAEKQKALEERCLRAVSMYYKGKVTCAAGSTDCNIPLSVGIPAVTVGTAYGEGTHTRREWVDIESIRTGQKIALQIILSYCERKDDNTDL